MIFSTGPQRANPTQWNGTDVATPDTAGYPKVTHKTGSGTGEILLTSGQVTVGTNNDKSGYALTAGSYVGRASSEQAGTIQPTSTNTTATATVSAVTTTRAQIRLSGVSFNDGGGSPGFTHGTAGRIALTAATTITATRGGNADLGAFTLLFGFDLGELF